MPAPSTIPTASSLPRALVLVGTLFTSIASTQAAVLASWDAWGSVSAADSTTSGFTATISGSEGLRTDMGSSDGTFGNGLSGASTSATRSIAFRNSANITLTVILTNNTGFSYTIDSLHFDFGVRTNGLDGFTASYTTGGLGPAATQIDTRDNLAASTAGAGTIHGFDYTLGTPLSDTTLANGESSTFTILFDDINGSGTSLSIIDNFAFQGTLIPEPSAALLGGLGLLALLRRRR